MKRILTAAVLIPIVLFAVFGGFPWLFFGVIAAIAALTFVEYAQLLKIGSARLALGLVAGLGLLSIPPQWIFLPLLFVALLAFALPLFPAASDDGFVRSAAMLLGVLYIFGAFKTAYLLGARNPYWLLFALMINWVGDSGAYYVGRSLGRHKMAPRVSPGKSWEGAAASVLFSTAFFVLIVPRFIPLALPAAVALALIGNIAGQIGDLAESALKRSAGAKDSGRLLPGHGGMLDRVDSVLFTVPAIYALVLGLNL